MKKSEDEDEEDKKGPAYALLFAAGRLVEAFCIMRKTRSSIQYAWQREGNVKTGFDSDKKKEKKERKLKVCSSRMMITEADRGITKWEEYRESETI